MEFLFVEFPGAFYLSNPSQKQVLSLGGSRVCRDDKELYNQQLGKLHGF